MKKAKVFLTNGEVADINLVEYDSQNWISDIIGKGIITNDSFFPFHSIVYILFEESVEVVTIDRAVPMDEMVAAGLVNGLTAKEN
jgi:hypothetical protein